MNTPIKNLQKNGEGSLSLIIFTLTLAISFINSKLLVLLNKHLYLLLFAVLHILYKYVLFCFLL